MMEKSRPPLRSSAFEILSNCRVCRDSRTSASVLALILRCATDRLVQDENAAADRQLVKGIDAATRYQPAEPVLADKLGTT